jgi:hypothetical protein
LRDDVYAFVRWKEPGPERSKNDRLIIAASFVNTSLRNEAKSYLQTAAEKYFDAGTKAREFEQEQEEKQLDAIIGIE